MRYEHTRLRGCEAANKDPDKRAGPGRVSVTYKLLVDCGVHRCCRVYLLLSELWNRRTEVVVSQERTKMVSGADAQRRGARDCKRGQAEEMERIEEQE